MYCLGRAGTSGTSESSRRGKALQRVTSPRDLGPPPLVFLQAGGAARGGGDAYSKVSPHDFFHRRKELYVPFQLLQLPLSEFDP